MADMMQSMFFLLIFVMGLSFMGMFRRELDAMTICLLGFPTGTVLWVMLSLSVLVLGIPFRLMTMSVLCLLWLLVSGLVMYQRKDLFTRHDISVISVVTVVFVVVSVLIPFIKLIYICSDSWACLNIARYLYDNAGFGNPGGNGFWWLGRGAFPGIVHAGAVFLGKDYFASFMPILNFWFLASFGWLIFKANRYSSVFWSGFISVISVSILVSTHFIVFQSFSIHTNMMAGVYFTYAVVGLWLYHEERKDVWLFLVVMSLIAFALCRVEGPVFALIVLVCLISQKEIPYKRAVSCVACFIFPIAAWYTKLISMFGVSLNTRFFTFNRIVDRIP